MGLNFFILFDRKSHGEEAMWHPGSRVLSQSSEQQPDS